MNRAARGNLSKTPNTKPVGVDSDSQIETPALLLVAQQFLQLESLILAQSER